MSATRWAMLALLTSAAVTSAAPSLAGQGSSGAPIRNTNAVTPKRGLPIADYARWRTIDDAALSADGRWVAWRYSSRWTGGRHDDELHITSVDPGPEQNITGGSGALFSADARWIAYAVVPSLVERERVQREGRAVPRRVELRELTTGETRSWDDAGSYFFSPRSTQFVIHKRPATGRQGYEGSDVILVPLAGGRETAIANVSWLAFNPSDALVAYVIDAKERAGNGVFVMTVATGMTRALDSAAVTFSGAAWSTGGDALAVLRGVNDPTFTHRQNALLIYSGLGAGEPQRVLFDNRSSGMAAGSVISELHGLEWSVGDDRVFFGLKAQEPTASTPPSGNRASDVNVYHWKDDRLQSLQARRAAMDRNRTDRAVALVDEGRVVVLSDTATTDVQVTRDGRWAVASDERPYVSDWEQPRADYYRVDVETGARRPIVRAQVHTFGLSLDGSRFLYWKDGHVWAYDLAGDRHVNLTSRVRESLTDAEWDYPQTTAPSYGLAGWTKDHTGIVLNGRYDLWYVSFDGGTPQNLTQGRGAEREMQLRAVRPGPDAVEIDLSRPVLLTASGRWTKRSGYYQLQNGQIRELAYTNHRYRLWQSARDAQRILFTRESWSEFPDLRVTSDDFATAVRVTNANPQQAEYAWGHRILIDFTVRGVRLQATLAIPDGWSPGTRLPMIVSFYEKRARWLHLYPLPRYAGAPLPLAAYTSNGYLVLETDIHFRGGETYTDMLEAVEAATASVVKLGYADPARIGVFGHSFSGDGAAFIATRSNRFAAIVAGALSANPISGFNSVAPGYGMNGQGWFVYDQGRFGTNPYDDFALYWRQSAIADVRHVNTPLLTMQGENDENSSIHFGLEFYNALRFNRKSVIFLSYPGEGHSLSRLENQLDFLKRMEEFYAHYLKGEPPPAWITKGERFLDKAKRVALPIRP